MAHIVLLGTGAALSDARREHTYLVAKGRQTAMVIDCEGSPVQRLSQAGIALDCIDHLLLTHHHPDHIYGVSVFLLDLWLAGRKKVLHVYGLAETLRATRAMMRAFEWERWFKFGFFPIEFHRIPPTPCRALFVTPEFLVATAPTKHLIPTVAVRVESNESRKSITYSSDTQVCETIVNLARGSEILFHEATTLNASKEGHASARQAGAQAKRARASWCWYICRPSVIQKNGARRRREHFAVRWSWGKISRGSSSDKVEGIPWQSGSWLWTTTRSISNWSMPHSSKLAMKSLPHRMGTEALSRVDEVLPELVVSDVEMPGMDGYDLTRRLRQKGSTAHLPIMILTSHDTVQEKIKGFESGPDDYMTKPFEPTELQARVRVLLRRATAPLAESQRTKGKTIALFSLRGGVGISTIAANLATGLAQMWGCRTGLVDLVLTSGQSALMLNLPLRHTWADLSHAPVGEMDADLIQMVLLQHASGASVLAAPNRPEQAELITSEKVSHVLTVLKERYPYLILDLPHDFSATTLAGLDSADEILLVLAPELASLHAASCALDVFDTLKYPRDIIRLVLNCTFEKRGLARKEIEDALQRQISVVIPFAPDPFVLAINRGAPPILETAPTPLGALLEDLAYFLSKPDHQKQPPANPSPIYQRVAARVAQRQAKR